MNRMEEGRGKVVESIVFDEAEISENIVPVVPLAR